jgi:hypothetical protein
LNNFIDKLKASTLQSKQERKPANHTLRLTRSKRLEENELAAGDPAPVR